MSYHITPEKRQTIIDSIIAEKGDKEIHNITGVSTATIWRIRKELKQSSGEYKESVEKSTKEFVSDGKSAEKDISENKSGKVVSVNELEKTQKEDISITLTFTLEDLKLYQLIEKNSKVNRRTFENEIMFILDTCVTVMVTPC